jgi:hypothetical protein
LELRLDGHCRSTKDLDLATLDETADGAEVRSRLLDALAVDEHGDGFGFAVDSPRSLTADRGNRPGWRFPVQARLAGRTFVNVRLDVALTRPYGDRPNTRVKDLVDLVLLTELGLLHVATLAPRVRTVFAVRASHPVPAGLPDVSHAWRRDYASLISELDLESDTVDAALAVVDALWVDCLAHQSKT